MTIIRTNFTKFAGARTATTFESLAQVREQGQNDLEAALPKATTFVLCCQKQKLRRRS